MSTKTPSSSPWVLHDIHSAISKELERNEWVFCSTRGPTIVESSRYAEDDIEFCDEIYCKANIQKQFEPSDDETPATTGYISASHSFSQEIVAVVVSEEEQHVLNEMNRKFSSINDHLLGIEENIRLLETLSKRNKNKINHLRSEMIHKINSSLNDLIETSDFEISQKLKELNTDKTKLKLHHEQLFNAKTKYNLLLMNDNLSSIQRKEEILRLTNNIPNDIAYCNTIIPKVKVSLNRSALRFMDSNHSIGCVRNYETPKPPILSLKTLTASTLIVQTHEMRESDAFILEIAEHAKYRNMEEEDAELEWIEVEYIKVSETECEINNLRESKRYCLRARYKNRNGFSRYSEVQLFKTKKVGLLIDATSRILDDCEYEKQILCSLLNKRKEQFVFRKLKCIFSSIQDGFDVNICHEKCQNERNILFIVHTNDDNIFGAFTKTSWKTDNIEDQKDEDSFIFLLRSSNEKYSPECFDIMCSQSMAVWYHNNYFCLFGTGYDISIYKTCARSQQYTYISKGNYSLSSKYCLNGDIKCFTVKNIEIFSCA